MSEFKLDATKAQKRTVELFAKHRIGGLRCTCGWDTGDHAEGCEWEQAWQDCREEAEQEQYDAYCEAADSPGGISYRCPECGSTKVWLDASEPLRYYPNTGETEHTGGDTEIVYDLRLGSGCIFCDGCDASDDDSSEWLIE